MTRARELANFADDTAGLETLTVSDITDLSVSASNINSTTNQMTHSGTDLNVHSNLFVVDKTNSKVGVGTTAPSARLSIEGSNNTLSEISLKNTNPNPDSHWAITPLYDADTLAIRSVNNSHANRMTISSAGDVTIPSGNVGIGNASPATTTNNRKNLQVGLGATVIGRTDDTPSYLSSNLTYNSGWKYIANTTASQIELGTNIEFHTAPSGTAGNPATLTERMRIDSSGNVGLNGNTNPATKLDFGVTSNNSNIIHLRKNSNSLVTLGVNSDYGARIAGPSDANAVVSFGNISMSDGSTFNESMRIDQNGNVGINDSTPFGKLNVVDKSWSSGSPYGAVATITGKNTNDLNWGHLMISDSTTGTIDKGGKLRFAIGEDGSNMNPIAGISGLTEHADADYGYLAFYTRPDGTNTTCTERMRIDSSGTVQIIDANSGSQQSTQDFKIGRATIQVANVNTTSSTSYGAGFTFKTYDYNGSSFVNHDALRITAKGDVVVGHDNYRHGTAHDPNEGSHGTALLKTNGDFVQTGGDYDPRSGNSQTLFTPYHRRTMVSNFGRTSGQSQDMWYMWYKIDGVDGIYSNGSTPYIELRVIGHSGHHSGSICRVIMINPASNDTGHSYLTATQMGKGESNRGYGQTLDVLLYGNTNGSNDVYMRIDQGQREPHVTIIADLYSCTRNMHSINNFGITYYGGGASGSTTQPSNVGSGRATFNN